MITDEQREKRRQHLGSSDVAAILGVDPWINAYDIWLEKTGQLDRRDERFSKIYEAGSMFEVSILNWAEQHLGEINKNSDDLEFEATGFPIVSHPDGIILSNGEPVEAKTAGLFGPLQEEYGEPLTDELPDRILIQCHVHMLATNKQTCHVPIFLGGRGFVMFVVKWDDVIMDTIMDTSIDFWDNFVLTKKPPPNIIPTINFVKRIKRKPKKVVQIDDVLVEHWQGAKKALKTAESIKDSAQAALLAALGDAEAGTCSYGMVTYYLQKQERIDATRLRMEKPKVAKEYTKVTKFRVPRLKKPPKKKGIRPDG